MLFLVNSLPQLSRMRFLDLLGERNLHDRGGVPTESLARQYVYVCVCDCSCDHPIYSMDSRDSGRQFTNQVVHVVARHFYCKKGWAQHPRQHTIRTVNLPTAMKIH